MSYELPISVEREVERYAEEANLSPAEAAALLIQSGLGLARKPVATGELSEEEWEVLRSDHALALLQSIPDSVIDLIEEGLRERRGEGHWPRG